jgi:hypothetical protein
MLVGPVAQNSATCEADHSAWTAYELDVSLRFCSYEGYSEGYAMSQTFTLHTLRTNATSAKNSEIEMKSAELAEAFAGLKRLRELVRAAEQRQGVDEKGKRSAIRRATLMSSASAMRSI